ncbi:MAG: tautomerase family protein [Oligoflexia bacterium]|nr:tautomerase family protein [Oligoflexia bacterium]
MPHVRIEMLKGKSSEYKKTITDNIHQALVEEFKTPENDRYFKIIEIEKENFDHGPRRSDDYLFIEILLFLGRSDDAKKKLYKNINDRLNRNPGINSIDIIIFLNETKLRNWGFGEQAGDEVKLSFNVNV